MKNTTPKNPVAAVTAHSTNNYISLSLAMSFTHGYPEVQEKIRRMTSKNGKVFSPWIVRWIKGLKPAKVTERSAHQKLWFRPEEIEGVIEDLQRHEVRGRIHRLAAASCCRRLNKSLGHYIGKPPKRLSHFYKAGKMDCFLAKSLYAFLRKNYVKPEPSPKKKEEVIPMFSGNDWFNQMIEIGRAPIPFFVCESSHPGEGKVAYLCCPVAESLAEQIHKALGK